MSAAADSLSGIPPEPCEFELADPHARTGRLLKLVYSSLLRSIDARMQPLELTALQWQPLFLLWRGRADTVAALARECEMDCGAMTRMLDRLEAKGLVRRHRSETDRRVVHLSLTDKGRESAAALPPVLREELARHLKDFTDQETELLISMLQRMLDNGTRG
jgi:DNA-binding MarR family transcriptional regulator|nr:MAG: MarR family transcriptional regulator [Pseudomonadota bacterium]